MRRFPRCLFALLCLCLFAGDAFAGIFRNRGKACPAGSCAAPASYSAPAPAHVTPKGDSVGYTAPAVVAAESACASGQCSAPAAKRGLFGFRR